MAEAKRLHLKLFVEGIECPVIGATITISPNSPSQAAIDIPPAESALDLKPRSLVFLFFKDFYRTVGNDTDYRLLFAGELMAVSYNKSSLGRSIQLICQDFSNYWDSCWYFKAMGSLFGFGGRGKWAGAAGKTLWDMIMTTGEKIFEVLKKGPEGYEFSITKDKDGKTVIKSQIPGLLGGMVALLQAIGGIYHTKTKYDGVSPFFTLAEWRLKLSRQLGVYPDQGPIKLMKRAGFGYIWDKELAGLGRQFNFRMAINALARYIFYEVYPNPAARYKPPTGMFIDKSASPAVLRGHEKGKDWTDQILVICAHIDDLRKRAANKEKFKGSEVSIILDGMIKDLNGLIQEIKQYQTDTKTKDMEKVKGAIATARKRITDAKKEVKGISKIASSFWKKMDSAEENLRKTIYMGVPSRKGERVESSPDFLYTQLFRPDLWLASPPRCNVIFPEQYTSLTFSRNFTNEITRLLMRFPENWLAGYDALFDTYAYAPRALGQIRNKKLVKKEAGELPYIYADLMEHELYTGVLPHEERARGLKVYGLRDNIVSDDKYKLDYPQKLCNFLFFKYRFGGRTITVSGPFNPYVVAGFPALVIDKEGEGGLHYLGQIITITHSVNQTGGNTVIQMAYARTQKENVRPIEADIDFSKIKIKGVRQFKTYIVGAIDEPKKGDRGLYGGEIENVNPLPKAKGQYPLLGTSRTTRQGPLTKVEVNKKGPAHTFGEQVIAMAGGKDVEVEIKAYNIIEKITREVEQKAGSELPIPFELMCRPAWYGRCWLNERIGAVYQELLGTGSITDPIKLDDSQAFIEADTEALQQPEFEDEDADEEKVLEIEAGSSIAEAVEQIVNMYTYVKQGGYDINEFINSFIWRPIATKIDIMGSSDLMFSLQTGEVLQGTEGFFSRAFGPYDNLFMLVPPDIASIEGVKRGDSAESRLDLRKERYDAVKKYILELTEGGGGIRG